MSAGAAMIHCSQLFEPGVGGAVTTLAIDPAAGQHVFAGGDMLGIGRSVNGGDNELTMIRCAIRYHHAFQQVNAPGWSVAS